MPRDTLTKFEVNQCLARDVLQVEYDQDGHNVVIWDIGTCNFVAFDPFEDTDQAEQVLKALGVEYTPYEDLILDALNVRLKG